MRTLKYRIAKVLTNLSNVSAKGSPVISFMISFLMLYVLDPNSYNMMFKGRGYYIFFMWLSMMIAVLKWRRIEFKIYRLMSLRLLAFSAAVISPIMYVLAARFLGLNSLIINLSPKHYGSDAWARLMPLATEYIVFAALFSVVVLLAYGVEGLREFTLPSALIGSIGLIFLIDNLYPYGEFTPFQAFVSPTATLASSLLRLLGYHVEFGGYIYETPVLIVRDRNSLVSFGIAWSCSGVDSLIIYSLITILFLEDSRLSLKSKIIFFLAGAIITYLINVLRIVAIFLIAIKYGAASLEVWRFHNYYGPLFSIVWILTYQLIVIVAQSLWSRRKSNMLLRKVL